MRIEAAARACRQRAGRLEPETGHRHAGAVVRPRKVPMIPVKPMSHATLQTPDLERQIDVCTDIVGLVSVARETARGIGRTIGEAP